MNYQFTSERLGFRLWNKSDLDHLAAMCADPEVMKHFPSTLNTDESKKFLQTLNEHYDKHGHTYFAVELTESKEFIGFIGLAFQDYDSDFTPATDIGWRLVRSAWGKGYATEGAKRVLEFAKDECKLPLVIATCTPDNTASINVMKKIGMTLKGQFQHPKLDPESDLNPCWCYAIEL